jgi:hypothetical protein
MVDHHIYTHKDIPVAFTRPNDTFPIGTLGKMIRLTRWSEDDLLRLGLIE